MSCLKENILVFLRVIALSLFKIYRRIVVRLHLKRMLMIKRAIAVFEHHVHPLLKRDTAQVLGHTMFLDSADSLLLSIYGVYEMVGTNLAMREIKKGILSSI